MPTQAPWYRNRWTTVTLHAAFWVLLLVVPYLLQPAPRLASAVRLPPPPVGELRLFNGAKACFWVALFYTNALVLVPRFGYTRRWGIYGACIGLALVALLGLELVFLNLFHRDDHLHVGGFMVFNLFPTLFIFASSVLYRIVRDRGAEEARQKEKESENLRSELSFLRSQISPHFMFNVLNNIVALARRQSPEVEPSLIRLSTILRYSLYESAQQTVSLERELEYLRTYVDLQTQRFGAATAVRLTCSEPDARYQIEPMLLIPFVENAFKHGVVRDGSIEVSLRARQGQLHFAVENDVNAQPSLKDDTSGIGQANVRRRLELLYGGRYELSIRDSGNRYSVQLNLKLH